MTLIDIAERKNKETQPFDNPPLQAGKKTSQPECLTPCFANHGFIAGDNIFLRRIEQMSLKKLHLQELPRPSDGKKPIEGEITAAFARPP